MAQSDLATGALRGIRVVDFGQYLAGPLAGMILADHGADVIHVSPPGGPRMVHPANAALLRNKRAIELDLKSDSGRAEALRLIGSADVVIENFRSGVMARLGLDPHELTTAHERLIWCSIPGFAAQDPRSAMPGWEGVVCAAVGMYPRHHFAKGDPLFTAMPLASNFGAFLAAHRIAAALISRMQGGRGQHIEVSLYEAGFQALGYGPEVPSSTRSSGAHISNPEVKRTRKAADGTYLFFDSPMRGLQRLVDAYIPGYDLLQLTPQTTTELALALDELIASRTGAEWERIGQEDMQGAFGLIQTTSAWLEDRHARESETIIAVEDGELGPTLQPGFPVTMTRARPAIRWGRGKAPFPAAGPIDWLEPLREEPRLASVSSGLPLEGIRIVDCASLLAGPTTARVLAQYGAKVIKVDRASVAGGDVDPMSDDISAFFGARASNAGKRMVYLDLQQSAGREVLNALVRHADIVHHNFTPEAARRLGLAPEQVRTVNPELIHSRVSLHSPAGYRAGYRGHDPVAQCVTGMFRRMGGDGPPMGVGIYVNDNACGHLHAFGLMMALLHRWRTGETQDVGCSLSQTATMHQIPFMVDFAGRTADEPSGPDARGWHALDRLYRARDCWFYLAHGGSDGRAALAGIAGLAGVAEVADADLEPWLEARFAEAPADEWVDQLRRAGFGAHRYLSLQDIVADEYACANRHIEIADHPGIGRAMGIGHPFYVAPGGTAEGSVVMRRPGMDTIAVLKEHGFGDRIVDLLENKIVAIGEMALMTTTTTRGWWNKPGAAGISGDFVITPELIARIENRGPA